jgi:hypothetical protein
MASDPCSSKFDDTVNASVRSPIDVLAAEGENAAIAIIKWPTDVHMYFIMNCSRNTNLSLLYEIRLLCSVSET